MNEVNHAAEWREFREAHDMSQAQMARVLGLVLRTVQGIELSEHKPSFTSRLRFRELKRRYAEARSNQAV
jgi:DNA-binding XRE family transcriptional regulator